MSIQVFGLPVSRGVAIGRAVLVASSRVDVAHYYVEASMIETEVRRLRAARDLVVQELTALKGDVPEDAHDELVALLDVHLMLLQDDTLSEATRQWIVERHYNAEWALSSQLEVIARQFDEMEDEYLRDRKADLEQVVERVITALGRLGGDSFDDPPAQRPARFRWRGSARAGGQRHRAGRHAQIQAQRFHGLRHRRRRAQFAHRDRGA